MGTTTRRGFLKGLGATLSAVGIATASSAAPALVQAGLGEGTDVQAPLSDPHPRVGGRAGRATITSAALEILVSEQLAEWMARGRMFTAYDVTRALRRTHPGVNIVHEQVRDIVHTRMWPAVTARIYAREQTAFPKGWAWAYRPM
jgi:hypothetical protein